MKKSFDYFKTFKILTEILNNIFKLSVDNKDYNKQYITFLANKNELIDNLKNDFITPIERGDIFILSDMFSREMNHINVLNDYSSFSWSELNEVKNSLHQLLVVQRNVFDKIAFEKVNVNIVDKANNGYNQSQRLVRDIYKLIKETIVGYCENPLLKYAVYVAYLELAKQLNCTFFEIERIILNNS